MKIIYNGFLKMKCQIITLRYTWDCQVVLKYFLIIERGKIILFEKDRDILWYRIIKSFIWSFYFIRDFEFWEFLILICHLLHEIMRNQLINIWFSIFNSRSYIFYLNCIWIKKSYEFCTTKIFNGWTYSFAKNEIVSFSIY